MTTKRRPECSEPSCSEVGVVRCGQCKVWYCSLQCQAHHWAQHRARCIPPPPLEWPDIHLVVSSYDKSQPPAKETKEKTEVEVEEKIGGSQDDAVKEISDDEKTKTIKNLGIKLEAAAEVPSLYPRALTSDRISPQRVPAKSTEVISVGSIISPTEFCINLAVKVKLGLDLSFLHLCISGERLLAVDGRHQGRPGSFSWLEGQERIPCVRCLQPSLVQRAACREVRPDLHSLPLRLRQHHPGQRRGHEASV